MQEKRAHICTPPLSTDTDSWSDLTFVKAGDERELGEVAVLLHSGGGEGVAVDYCNI